MLLSIALGLIALLVALALSEAITAWRDAFRFSPPGEMVGIGTHSLHAIVQGDGPVTVLFEAGAGSTAVAWSLVQPDIAALARTVSYDRGGLGWSERGPRPRTIGRLAIEFEQLLARVGAPPPYVLVAHSMGGAVALEFAARHPQAIAGLVFVDAAYAELYEAYIERFPAWWKRIRRSKLLLRGAVVASRLGIMRLARIKLADARIGPEAARASNAVARRPRYLRAIRDEMDGLEQSRGKTLPAVAPDIPAVVLSHSETKPLLGKEAGAEELWKELQQALAERFSGEYRVVEDAGHFIQIDRPQAVIDAIRAVLSKVNTSA